jgi:hypothetical protein
MKMKIIWYKEKFKECNKTNKDKIIIIKEALVDSVVIHLLIVWWKILQVTIMQQIKDLIQEIKTIKITDIITIMIDLIIDQ